MQVEYAWNPIALTRDRVILDVVEGISPNQIILGNALCFSRPVICMVNGNFWSRKDWDFPVPIGGVVRFVELPRGGGTGGSNPLRVIAVIALVAAAYFTGGLAAAAWGATAGSLVTAGILIGGSMLLNMFFGADQTAGGKSSDYGSSKAIYSVGGGSNRLRIGEPFSEHFGRMIVFPDLVQASYTRMEGNEQYLYFIGFVGVGEYDIENVYINKTPMGDYLDASYNVVIPYGIPSITTSVVWVSPEVTGQEISTDFFTAVVSGPGTSAMYLEYDLLFPQLISYTNNGDAAPASVSLICEVRTIDNRGEATSAWTPFHSITYTESSKDSLRYSNKIPPPLGAGRYEFRIARTVPSSTDMKVVDKVSIVGLKAYGGPHPNYGDVTILEAKIKATDQLNGDVASRINTIATRKLRAVGPNGMVSGLVATRSIIDAIAYIITSPNGAGQPESFINYDVLFGLKAKLDISCEHWFDWRFSGKTTVMAACAKASQCGRAVPYMPGGQFAVVRDDHQEIVKMVYTEDDYDEDSINIVSAFPTVDAYTCVKIKYIDGETWQDSEIVYYDVLGSQDIPYELVLEGCTDRQQAWEMASYLYRDMVSNSTSIEFTTGLKGHLPSLFDKVALSLSNIDWGQSGKVVGVESGRIYTSEPLNFGSGSDGKMYTTDGDGKSVGPITVVEDASNPYCAVGTLPGQILTLENDVNNATSYLFGPAYIDPMFVRVMSINPQGRNKVRISGSIITKSVYDDPGPAGTPAPPIAIGFPLEEVFLDHVGILGVDHQYSVTWVGSSTEYKIEINAGTGYSTLADNFFGHHKEFTSTSSIMTVKVSPYDASHVLIPSNIKYDSYSPISAPATVTLVNADADSVDVSWDIVSGATAYDVSIIVSNVVKGTRRVYTNTASVTTDELTAIGGPWDIFTISVSAIVGYGVGTPAILNVTILPMAAPTGLTLQQIVSNGVMLSWNSVVNATGYKLYSGTTAGFNPATTGTLLYSGSANNCTVVCDVLTPYDNYFKVAATNGYFQVVGSLAFGSALRVNG